MSLKNILAKRWRQLPDDGRLSIGAAIAFFATEAIGSLVNLFFPETLSVVGMSIVGCFYLLLGIASLARCKPERAVCASTVVHVPRCTPRNRPCDAARMERCTSLESRKIRG